MRPDPLRPERDNPRGRTLLAALLVCALLSGLHLRAARSGRMDPVTGAVRDFGLVPAQTLAANFGQWWHLHPGSLLAGPRLARDNAALKAQVLALSAQNKELLAAQAENTRLRQLVGFQARSPRPLLAAQVIALKPSPQTDTLTLNRGSSAGVHPHSVVLSPSGALVGQVVAVSAHSAEVLLLTDAGSSVGALVHNAAPHGPVGLCQGDGAGGLRVTYLRSDAKLAPGDAVTTSGLGGVFPRDLPLGAVQTVAVDRTRSLQTAALKAAAGFDHLEEVFVIGPTPAP